MGPIPSRPSLSNVVNTLQSAFLRRSDRRVEPAPESELSADTSVLTAKRLGKHRRFGTWKRNPKRSSCSCDGREDDDYTCVFGRQQRPGCTQSLPPVIPVRRCRPDYPPPLPPASECRLFIENIEIEERTGTLDSTFEEEDVESGRFERELSTPVIPPCGRPRTMFSSVVKTLEPTNELTEPVAQQLNLPEPGSEPEPVKESEPEIVEKEPTEETPPCVCALPSKKTCPCDKQLFEAMGPWNKVKTVLLSLLGVALVGWLIAFFLI